MRVSIHQAKTQLSKLIAAAERGEEVVIARRETPVVKIVPVQPAKKRVFGALKGKIDIGPEFFDPLPDDELARWNGG
ncbi:MAG: type II toxin-antitoxin system prevent-host-death family antitoxin [Beijerinckiaceae bacterium]